MPRFLSILIVISHLCVFAHADDENIALLSESVQTTLHSGPGGLALFGENQHNRVHHNTRRLFSFFIPLIDNKLDHLWWDTGTVLLDSRIGYRKVIDTPLLDQYWFWGVHGGWSFYTTLKKPDDKGASYYLKHGGIEIAGSCWGQLTVNFYRVFDDFPKISDTTDFKRREHLNFFETSTIQAESVTCLDAQGVSAKITPLLFKNLKISALFSYSKFWVKKGVDFGNKKAYRFGVSGEYALSSQVSVQGQYVVLDTHCKDKDLWSVGIRFCGNGSYLSNDLFQGRLKRPAEVDIPQYFKYNSTSKETDTESSLRAPEAKESKPLKKEPRDRHRSSTRRGSSRNPAGDYLAEDEKPVDNNSKDGDKSRSAKEGLRGGFASFFGKEGGSQKKQKRRKEKPSHLTDNDSSTGEEVTVKTDKKGKIKIDRQERDRLKTRRSQSQVRDNHVSSGPSRRRSAPGRDNKDRYTSAYDNAWNIHRARWEEEQEIRRAAQATKRPSSRAHASTFREPNDDHSGYDERRMPFANNGDPAHYNQQENPNFAYAGFSHHQRYYPQQPEYPESYWENDVFYYWCNGVRYSKVGGASEHARREAEWRAQETENRSESPKPRSQPSKRSMHSEYETAGEFRTPRKPSAPTRSRDASRSSKEHPHHDSRYDASENASDSTANDRASTSYLDKQQKRREEEKARQDRQEEEHRRQEEMLRQQQKRREEEKARQDRQEEEHRRQEEMLRQQQKRREEEKARQDRQEEEEHRRQEEMLRRQKKIKNQLERPANIDRFMTYAEQLNISMDGKPTASQLKQYTPEELREAFASQLKQYTPEKLREALKKPYRAMGLKAHPDHGGDKEVFQNIQNCYEALIE